jgi:ABC-type bacteriocin/lantibiotic exporter with double-glycine peptidase domain
MTDKSTAFSPLQRLNRLLKLDRKDITQVYVYALLNGLVNLSLPIGIQSIINLIQGAQISTSWIVMVVFVILGITISGLLQLMQLRIVENIAQRTFARASFEMAVRIPRIKFSELYDYYAPELANRFFDTITIQKGLPKILIDFSLASFQIVVGLILLSLYHPFFIVFGVILIALVYTIFVFTGPVGLKTSLAESKYKYRVAHWLEEIARSKLTFKLASEPMIALQKVDDRVEGYLNNRESHFRVLIRQFLHLIGFKVMVAAGLLIIGSLLVFRQEMNIGQFVAAEIIIIIIISSVEKLITSLDSIYDVLTALEKIGQVTDMQLDNEKGLSFDSDHIEISAQNLSFTYPESKQVLKNLTFQLPADTSVCLLGESGSGKSTLLRLLSGILQPDQGVINFNGLSLNSIRSQSLRQHVGFALKDSGVFQGSIYDNIALGRPDIGLPEVLTAIEITKLKGFVSAQADGLYTSLDPTGQRIPGSVSNKIILARAIASKPKLLIMEDPLDQLILAEKEEIVQKLVDKDMPWNIIISAVDTLWQKYIPNSMTIDQGTIKSINIK